MALRMIEMRLPAEHIGDVEETVDDLDLVDLWRVRTEADPEVWHLVAFGEQVEAIVDALEDRFALEEGFRLLVFNLEATIPRPEPESDEEDEQESQQDDADGPADQAEDDREDDQEDDHPKAPINIEELYEDLTHGMEPSWAYAALVAASAIVAAAGVYRDDLVLLIGAMIIAPLLHPNMALSLATTMADADLAKRALKVGVIGAGLTVAVAVAFGLVLPFDPDPASTSLRTTVGVLDVAVAASAGTAGALSFTSTKPTGVVGVMIAAALLPPLVSFGMLVGAGHIELSAAPLLLVLINVICINLAGVVTFFVQHIRPRARWEEERARRAFRTALGVWVALLLLLIGLGYFAGRYWTILI